MSPESPARHASPPPTPTSTLTPAAADTTSSPNPPGIYSSRPTLDIPAANDDPRPAPVKYMSTPAYQSPLRHHARAASSTRRVKETLNARSEYSNSEDDGSAQHRINQYLIKQEIGRGSFGAVHLAVDQYGQEYAVKEFSKSRLRKRAQSNLLRRPSNRRRALPAGIGFNSPLHRHSSTDGSENNAFELIKEEIAIMKKLNHPNLVSLVEVLDDPEEDSLYMVMEMCKKGVVMQVGLEERADPYSEEQCRCWLRDMVLGLEYLHAQGIIHRDIKPDNCLVTEDDVLKIVDFGVSEMFDKDGEMKTAKSAGSPAFMPPELCVAKHGHVSGRAADIWSMGCTLYCLLFGRIPFEKHGMIELYQAIRMNPVEFDSECNEELKDLLLRLLEKDPKKRINIEQLREHPWVTRHGADPLLPKSENVAIIIEPPTDEEVNAAITGNMGHLVTVVQAVKRFKQLLFRRRPERLDGILGSASRIVQPPLSMRPSALRKSKSQDTDNRRPVESVLAAEGVHRDGDIHERRCCEVNSVQELTYNRVPRGGLRYSTVKTLNHHKTQCAQLTKPYRCQNNTRQHVATILRNTLCHYTQRIDIRPLNTDRKRPRPRPPRRHIVPQHRYRRRVRQRRHILRLGIPLQRRHQRVRSRLRRRSPTHHQPAQGPAPPPHALPHAARRGHQAHPRQRLRLRRRQGPRPQPERRV
ncbi:hypothetical protein B5807_11555 [Epicoccum nigrum]|uniref:Protein kinase domain-containing protein n=1 Tax=Epicoccum nigrum TaxID=105696 RepID=A0A1Y2LI72_EPING|nr:hypothetical protein B5807_11555 [Epicoccum nigrum]